TMVAGGGTNNPESVNVLVREGPEEVLNLVKLGVEFDTDMLGRLHLTLEGGHSRSRIVHHRDTTGFEVVTKLIARIRERANIDFLENSAMLRLECAPGGGFYAGVLHGGALHGISARSCILATGGVGRIYEFTTNSRIATGDGIRFAGELGARVKNLSLIQFHPTAFDARLAQQERFLISEAVRGEGGLLLNCRGERFMPGYDKRAELAPRDVVSDCIRRETIKTGSSDIFLDISFKDADFLRDRFPSIYSKCLEAGVDITKDRIPVFPCQHYLIGGIDVDTFARTTVPGLYAVGECSHTGVHGNNRLASNSLLEALVFPRRALRDIVSAPQRPLPAPKPMSLCGGAQPPQEFYKTIRSVMQKSFFIIPDPDEARRSLPVIEEIDATLEAGHYAESRETIELKSMARVAKIILKELCER
ncbi:MAG: FAD-binding protein, partial [Clostridia bacterium]|nr:FAD-binding protein [Clostridia bacterium]